MTPRKHTSSMVGTSLSLLLTHQLAPHRPFRNCCRHCLPLHNTIQDMKNTIAQLTHDVEVLKQAQNPRDSISNANMEMGNESCPLYNGYSKEQLKCKLIGCKTFWEGHKAIVEIDVLPRGD
ncbi:uncharacterized protein LOC117341300 [Pecten maximus]|uniref:uncharacterized protein LOC117341300 n=1 Tax=Pecten maximus TaxID=6579 RepID=UPI0014589CB0|nr:uncharacterized protein LOC117341300 [Pecten maximus]